MIDFEVDVQGFQDFTRNAAAAIEDPEQKRTFYRAYALRFLQLVIPRTPVDTGRARAAWTAGGATLGLSSIAIGGTEARAKAEGRALGQYREIGFGKDGQEARIEIFNGVPYIVFLELGSSMQAPSGFVRITLREMMAVMTAGEIRRVEAALRLANAKTRGPIKLRQGGPRRDPHGRANLRRRV